MSQIQVARRLFRLGESSGYPFSTATIGPAIILYRQNYGESKECLVLSLVFMLFLNRLLPDWVPFHPHRWWIHVRNAYIPMSYLYGVKFKMPENDLILSLREVGITICMSVYMIQYLNRNYIQRITIVSIGRPNEIMLTKLTNMLHTLRSSTPSTSCYRPMNIVSSVL